MQLARFFIALAVLAFAMLATAENGPFHEQALAKRQSSSASTPASTSTQEIAYTPGIQVGPSSYVAPTGATGVPVSPTNTGPVGGALNAGLRTSPMILDTKVASLGLLGVVVGGAWMLTGL